MKKFTFALAGNPNCGKTTFFNTLTGSHHHVGNWPGKTVEKREGSLIINNDVINIIDLPGIYSITSFSEEEKIAKDFIILQKPDLVIDILDATNLQRNLYLALELLELKTNVILAVNMADQAVKIGTKIDIDKMSKMLNIPIFIVDARKKDSVRDLIINCQDYLNEKKNIKSTYRNNEDNNIMYSDELEEHLNTLENEIKKYIDICKIYEPRWFAIKLLEGDIDVNNIIEKGDYKAVKNAKEKILRHFKDIFGENHDTIIADERHGKAAGIIMECMTEKVMLNGSISDRIDKIVTNNYFSIPIFLLTMFLLFYATFFLARPFVYAIQSVMNMLSQSTVSAIAYFNFPQWVSSLFVSGIIGGIGSVLVFVPNIFVMFFLISLLEDSGYMARAAYIMDNIMHKIGLHGKSFIPLILGFGCNVPAIMSTRSLDNKKDRILTILLTPFMSCSARLPIYILFVGAFFTKYQGTVIFLLYLLGIIVAILSGLLFKWLFFKNIASELILEIPPYRLPTLKGAFIHTWEKTKIFLQKMGTLIFSAAIVVWFLSNLPLGVKYASKDSIIGIIGSLLSPLLHPIGFGNWQSAVALLFGIFAKEIVVSTFGAIYGASGTSLAIALHSIFTPLSAISFLVMTLIYVPCIATIIAIKNESGSWKWAAFIVIYTICVGWLLAFIIYQGGLLLGYV